ncbi:MAG: hypothetical protein VYE22_32610 [Myxococcota bacterium]|nr:hypothetical protein [Myxococcota bacterium]
MTAPSMQARGTYALTTRCVFRKLLLTPRTPMLHQGLTYALARAARKTGVVVNHVSIIPNHVHQVVTSTRRNLPVFKRLFVGEASKLVKAYLREHGFEEPENVFTRTHQMRLVNAAAQLVYLHYEDIQPVKDGLVERVADYPGFHTDPGMLMGHDLVVARPPLHFDPHTNPEEERLRIGTTPLLAGEIGTRRVVEHLERARREAERAMGRERRYPVLGAERLKRQHPWAEPASRRKRRRGVAPSFRVVDDHALTIHCKKEVRSFRARHREALEKLRAGERDVVFPAGSYLMRVCYGAEVEEPDHDSVLARDERYEELPGRVSKDELRAISETLRSISGSVDPNAEPLAERIREGQAASVGQREARKVEVDADEERPPSKLVPLRGRGPEDTSAAPRDAREPDRPPDEPTDS